MDRNRVSRRSFIGQGAAIGAGLAATSFGKESAQSKAKVVSTRNTGSVKDGKAVGSVVDKMVAAVVKGVTGEENVDEAWRTIAGGTNKTVALKFNGLFAQASTQPEVTTAVVKGLVAAGIPQKRIFLYDHGPGAYRHLGYSKVPGFPGVRCLTAKEDGGFGKKRKAGTVPFRLAKLVETGCDVLINVPRIKHHVIAGATVALKNHLGSLPKKGANAFHRGMQYLPDLNAVPEIADKTRLVVVDGLVGIFDKGPSYHSGFTWEECRVLAGTDPVAVDAVCIDILKKHRKTLGRRYRVLRPRVKYLDRAGEIGFGVPDLDKIDVVNV